MASVLLHEVVCQDLILRLQLCLVPLGSIGQLRTQLLCVQLRRMLP